MRVSPTALPGVLLVQPAIHRDMRGHFLETFHADRYAQAGIPGPFVQDNLSFSQRGVLRGLHYQWPNPQGKLVYVLQGEVFDVAVDIRRDSPTFGRWVGVTLSADNHHQLWIPPGFAHGFCVTSNTAYVAYKCTEYYAPQHEHCLRWSDPTVNITWPNLDNKPPLVSPKDQAGMAWQHIGGYL